MKKRSSGLTWALKATLAASVATAAFACGVGGGPSVTCLSGPCGETGGGSGLPIGTGGRGVDAQCPGTLVVRYLKEGCPGTPVCVSGTGGACASGKVACGCDGIVYFTTCGGESQAPFSHYLPASEAQPGDSCQPQTGTGGRISGTGGAAGHSAGGEGGTAGGGGAPTKCQ